MILIIVLFAFICVISGSKIAAQTSKEIRFDFDLDHLVVDRNTGNVSLFLFQNSIFRVIFID